MKTSKIKINGKYVLPLLMTWTAQWDNMQWQAYPNIIATTMPDLFLVYFQRVKDKILARSFLLCPYISAYSDRNGDKR